MKGVAASLWTGVAACYADGGWHLICRQGVAACFADRGDVCLTDRG